MSGDFYDADDKLPIGATPLPPKSIIITLVEAN